MRCVQCGHLEDKVIDSRMSKDGTTIRRRRVCLRCDYRYTTYEQIERTELRVVKRDNRRSPGDRKEEDGERFVFPSSQRDKYSVKAFPALPCWRVFPEKMPGFF